MTLAKREEDEFLSLSSTFPVWRRRKERGKNKGRREMEVVGRGYSLLPPLSTHFGK